ncbi:MAG: hypothetical protein ACPGVY_01720 [Mycobacterium sp.]
MTMKLAAGAGDLIAENSVMTHEPPIPMARSKTKTVKTRIPTTKTATTKTATTKTATTKTVRTKTATTKTVRTRNPKRTSKTKRTTTNLRSRGRLAWPTPHLAS